MNRDWLRGQALLDFGRFAEAAKEFGRSMATDDVSQRANAQAMLAFSQLETGEETKARINLFMARGLAPESRTVRAVSVVFAHREGDFAAARKELAAIRADAPANVDCIAFAARFECMVGTYQTALEYAREGLAVDPCDEDCLEVASCASVHLGDLAAARSYVDRLLAIAPSSTFAHVAQTCLAITSGDIPRAREHAVESRRLAPTLPEAHLMVVVCDAIQHPLRRLLGGEIGRRHVPVWLRIAVLFIPATLAAVLELGFQIKAPSPILNRLINPLWLIGVWLTLCLGWEDWYIFVRGLADRNIRQAARTCARFAPPLVITTGTLGVLLGLYLFAGLWVVGSVFVGLGASLNLYVIVCLWHEHARRTWVIAPHLIVAFLAVILEAAGWSGASWAAPVQLALVIALFAEFLLLGFAAGPSSQPPPLPPSAASRSKPPPLPAFAMSSEGGSAKER